MKIKELKINGFGKIENKEIELDDNINVIYGENEAGKSTLLKFITGMFYGLSKNKNGGNIPDIEKLEPWHSEEFSGKLKYELDDKEKFEIYREFKKKNPKIFNQNLEDISKEFTIDKTKGNRFFVDQTGLEEDIFITSVITKQGEVKLDDKSQNNIIQKISNILGTGEDNTSYSKIVTKLKKKLNDEIGTNNTKEKPINILEKRIENIEREKLELENYQNNKFKIEEDIKSIKLDIIDKKERLETLKTANIKLDTVKAEESKINVIKKMLEDTQKEIEEIKENRKDNIENTNTSSIKTIHKIIILILFIISVVSIILLKNKLISLIPIIITVLFSAYLIVINHKNKVEIRENKKEYKEKLKALESKKNVEQEELESLENSYNSEIEKICKHYSIENENNILKEISSIQSNINELTLRLHTIEIDYQNISLKLENLINLEEELESLKEDKKELEQKREEIKKAIEVLEISYNKMKEEITPKFTDKLSKSIEKISDGKYKNVRINLSGEIIVEDKNGEYISAENLSIGTIDQLYLSLRLATIEEISKETMPIILDEAFAYYDNERLKNILYYLSKEYSNRQIIIFTCTKREIEILDKENIEYKLIQL